MRDEVLAQMERENAELKSRIDAMCTERQKLQIEQRAQEVREVTSNLPSSVRTHYESSEH